MPALEHTMTMVAALEAKGFLFEADKTAWIEKLEQHFGHRLPGYFRELVTNFRFPEFDICGITVFANLNDGSAADITVAPFADQFMLSWLRRHHFVQFGRPDTGTYDPVCFDLAASKVDPPVVVIEHEDVLLERKSVRLRQLADSFLAVIDAELVGKQLRPIVRKVRFG